MASYAQNTTVPVSRSREDIERTLNKYGATGFMYGQQGDIAAVAFEMNKRRYRMEIRYPRVDGASNAAKARQEQEIKRLWRALLMVIKAKLEAVKSGIVSIEDEFLSYTVMPNNETVKQWLEPQIDEVYRSGKMPPLIPGLSYGTPHKRIAGPDDSIEGEVV